MKIPYSADISCFSCLTINLLMSSLEEPIVNSDVVEHDFHFGKIQFLRYDHGYIRTKAKIDGIRDIKFLYEELDSCLKEKLTLGSEVMFLVIKDKKEKLIAISIQLTNEVANDQFLSVHNSAQTSCVFSEGSFLSSNDESSQSSHDILATESSTFVPRTPASMLVTYEKQKEQHQIEMSFNEYVDNYLEKVISRQYCKQNSSCWLV